MAITYHAGRRIQGTSGTTTTVTTSKITNTNGSNNSSGFSQITGIVGNALQQSGGGNYNLGTTIILNPSAANGWSVNMWVKIPAPSGNQYWLQYNTDQASYNRSIFYMYRHSTDGLVPNYYDGTGQRLNVDAGGTTLVVANSNFTVGAWNMVTFTWNNTDKKFRVYVDGVVKLTSKAHTHTNAGQWTTPLTGYTLGNYSGGTSGSYDSEAGFDEWSYWKDTLSQADIDELYNSGNAIAATALSNATAISKLAVYYDWEDSANGTLTNQCPTTVNVTSPVAKPTNVQLGSRFEETDTRKMYHYKDPITYETETFTPNWEQNTTGTQNIAVANSRVEYDVTDSGTLQSTLVYDLGTANISETEWVLRGKCVIDNYSSTSGSSCHFFCGLSNGDKTVAFDGSQNSISFAIGVGTADKAYYLGSSVNGSMYAMTNQTSGNITHLPTAETVYFEIIRNNATSATIKLYTDSTYTTSPSGYSRTLTLSSAPTGLRYLVFKSRDRDISGNSLDGHVDDLKFYNGLTSVPTGNVWTEEGT